MKKREEFDSDLRAAMSDAAKQSPTMTIAIWIAVKISRSLYEQERAKAEATIAELRKRQLVHCDECTPTLATDPYPCADRGLP